MPLVTKMANLAFIMIAAHTVDVIIANTVNVQTLLLIEGGSGEGHYASPNSWPLAVYWKPMVAQGSGFIYEIPNPITLDANFDADVPVNQVKTFQAVAVPVYTENGTYWFGAVKNVTSITNPNYTPTDIVVRPFDEITINPSGSTYTITVSYI